MGLVNKSTREVVWTTVLCAAGALFLEGMFAFVFHSFGNQLAEQWAQMEFIQNILKSLLGTEIGGMLTRQTMNSIAWVHPVLLAILWAHAITICTRVPAGEVDRGTIDVLLSLPVSRRRVYVCESLVWALSGAMVVLFALLGCFLGNLFIPAEDRPDYARLLIVLINLYAVYATVGSLALLVSSLSDRRGRAVAVAFGIVIFSFFLNFLAQFWEPARSLSFVGLLNYYRPLDILRDAVWPVYDLIVLFGCTTVLWVTGGVIFSRRDICTV